MKSFYKPINPPKIKKDAPAIKHAKELNELLFIAPYCRIDTIVGKGLAVRQTASRYLKELEKIGILRSEKIHKEMIFLNSRLYELLAGMQR